ncbi:MAG: hypothetical protein JKX76_00705 [Colwellia sp.]|nr:hypothetical protein [Colwellia sp.]
MSDNLKDLPVDEIPLTKADSDIISSLLNSQKESSSASIIIKLTLLLTLIFFLLNIPQINGLIGKIPFLGSTDFNTLIVKTVLFLIFTAIFTWWMIRSGSGREPMMKIK